MKNEIDVIIIDAGAAGLMCALTAGLRGLRVLILDKTNHVGKKILMSGGGHCNFTNLSIEPHNYISNNPHFCKSALNRYTQWDFIAMVEAHKIAYIEKNHGQLFCKEKSRVIVDMLLKECSKSSITIKLQQTITKVIAKDGGFTITCQDKVYFCKSLVVATGGLSIPTLGASPFGYQLATQFGLPIHKTRAGLVPLTLHSEDKDRLATLAGVAVNARVTTANTTFSEDLLFTHRGLSGPAILQISSYWHPGDELNLALLPNIDLYIKLCALQKTMRDSQLKTALAIYFPKRLLTVFLQDVDLDKPLKQFNDQALKSIAKVLQNWILKPNGTEGYRTAEVTLGGVDCNAISSQSFEVKTVPGLFFIGEVLDVSGWLGGYNFQWAWSSGWAAGQHV